MAGHLGRMSEERLPKMMLLGEMKKKRPCHRTMKSGEIKCWETRRGRSGVGEEM